MSRPEALEILDELAAANDLLFGEFPFAEFERLLDATPPYRNYNFKTENMRAWWAAIESHGGSAAVSRYNRALLIYLMARFDERAADKVYPESILELFEVEFARIVQRVGQESDERFAVANDLFQKDLGICRQILFPVGNSLYEESGLPRSLMFRGAALQFIQFAFYLAFIGHGARPYYEGHVHLDATDLDFREAAREEVRYRVAEMLRLNKDVKGMTGTAWLYDPALEKISPKMMTARNALLRARGWFFFAGIDDSGSALSKSKTRQRLFAEGKYVPKLYALAWPRGAMLNWADSVREEIEARRAGREGHST